MQRNATSMTISYWRFIRRPAHALLFLASLLASCTSNAAGWSEFSLQNGKFMAAFPGAPDKTEGPEISNWSANSVTYCKNASSAAYCINHREIRRDVVGKASDAEILQKMRDVLASKETRTILHERYVSHHGMKIKDLVFMESTGAKQRVWLAISGTAVYMLVVSTTLPNKDLLADPQANHFFQSFKPKN